MEKIQEYVKNPKIAAAIGFVFGIIIGLFVLGYWLFPVQWTDAAPEKLHPDYQDVYFCMTAQSYFKTGDAATAKQNLEYLGPVSEEKLKEFSAGQCGLDLGEVEQFKAAVSGVSTPSQLPTGEEPVVTDPEKSTKLNPVMLIVVLCLVTLIIGAALAYIFFFRNRKNSGSGGGHPSPAFQAQMMNQEAVQTDFAAEGQEPPIVQFMSTYVSGDDLYDDSFSIDSPSGEFLGECGIGISETIGVGEPKKVTAFEVWLFDKNDIQTVTKVLMSQHAFDDGEVAQRLASKGEPVLLEPGSRVILETATLQLEARVVDMEYGQGALPEGSFFDRLTLELAIWPKSA